jgi:hypothetical protein
MCNGTGTLRLAPLPPPLPAGDIGRCCSSCGQRFPLTTYCGHNTHDTSGKVEWWCSPQCYAEGTGDTRPWDEPREPETPLIVISLFR